MAKLKIGKNFSLPLETFVTGTQAIMGQKRTGKSYKGSVEAEELLKQAQQIVIVDPTSAWWGLRSSADGKHDGFPITIFGGEHADVPLESTAGAVIAEAIVEERFSAILDLSLFTKGEEQRFCGAFLETLYRRNREAMHLFLDEADVYAPQRPFGDELRTLGACQSIVRRGGIRGIGITLITQRPQVLNKDVLSQVDMLTLLRMSHPTDMKAIDAWVSVHGDPKDAKDLIKSLPALPKGEAWLWSPSAGIFELVQFRDRETFDSGRTPRAGEKRAEPKRLAPVDIERLSSKIAATVEAARDRDPKHLRERIAELEKQLAAKPVPVRQMKDARIRRVEMAIKKLGDHHDRWVETTKRAGDSLRALLDNADGHGRKLAEEAALLRRELAGLTGKAVEPRAGTAIRDAVTVPIRRVAPADRDVSRRSSSATATINGPSTSNGVPQRHVRVLESIAWWEAMGVATPSLVGTAYVAGYSPRSSGYEKTRSELRTQGLIEYPSGGTMRLTDAGRAHATTLPAPVSELDLHRLVLDKLEQRMGRMLRPLIEAYPKSLTTDELADASQYSATSSGFEKTRSQLRTLGLIDYPASGTARAADVLFPESAR